MQFTTPIFFIFLPTLFLLYLILNNKYKWILLLSASFYFYISIKPIWGLFLLWSIMLSYLCAIQLEKANNTLKKSVCSFIPCLVVFFPSLYVNTLTFPFSP